MSQAFSAIKDADKVETFRAFFASIFTIRVPKLLCLDTNFKQRNKQWKSIKSEISTISEMVCINKIPQ